ncbi:cytochrome c3 family protein [Desulfovibrio sp. UCD-KL4C]|uniref:cytochrome c3 family protein n=1 Tax=Desulfovibrio sp. UCD-KL4C TaxID=2578120 RepID=UPI0025BD2CF3|nr:cytochrome c3 family protein [Desulfovibrio sp. UCD-KL4C]
MKNRYTPLTLIVAVLVIAAASGFLFAPPVEESPVRVVMDNSGGRVIFSHAKHVEDLGYDCADCHHDNIGQDKPLACVTCHPVAFDKKFRSEHQKNFPDKKACLRCHDEVPTGPLAKEDRPDTENIPLLSDAFHQQCMGCHEQDGGPYGADSCYKCHAR